MTITTLDQIIPTAASRDAGAVAMIDGDHTVNWGALDDATRGVATALHDAGVRPGDKVGIVLRRSITSMIAVHAVLRAGAAYVPIDADTPAARRKQIAAACSLAAVLSEPGQRGKVEALAPVILGTDKPLSDYSAPAAPQIDINPDDDAYVIFTSGSTGAPKGIVHTHASGLAYGAGAAALYQLSSTDRVAFTNALHFDMSTFELFSAPIAGASLVVISEIQMRFPVELASALSVHDVSVVFTVPFALVSMLDRASLDSLDHTSLRLVMFGGELLEPAALRGLMAAWPGVRFSNSYGPAEVNQCTVAFFDAPPCGDEVLSIGTATHGASLRVAPIDAIHPDATRIESGELWVASPTQMRDYADGDHTRLVEHDGRRWYRTGDVVERRGDDLVFVGRVDNQVKIRGFRVELEAVEHALCGHETVAVAVAAVSPSQQLVAAVLPCAGQTIEPRSLLRELAATLPGHFVPTSIEIVDGFPQGSTGKVDRRTVRDRLRSGTSALCEEICR